jgi:hypothetical protein
MLHARGVAMQAKPFSIGVRIEHPQGMIDQARFGPNAGNPLLGAADYKLVHHAENGRAVYSFCMCPGGTVVAATSEAGRVVTNGMSQYSRAERNANAGIVVGISPEDYPGDVLAGLAYQRHWESAAFIAGGGDYRAPAQLVGDFLAGRPSTGLGEVMPSYKPGVTPTDLAKCLPDFAVEAMREALLAGVSVWATPTSGAKDLFKDCKSGQIRVLELNDDTKTLTRSFESLLKSKIDLKYRNKFIKDNSEYTAELVNSWLSTINKSNLYRS